MMASIYCLECGTETEHFTISGSARHAQVTRTTIYNWLARGRLHTVQRPSGRTLVCSRSLVIYPQQHAAPSTLGDPVRQLRVLSF
jgi:hypothetical protein